MTGGRVNYELMTTGRGLMAARPWASGELFGVREPAMGLAISDGNPLECCPTEERPAASSKLTADSFWPVVVGCSF